MANELEILGYENPTKLDKITIFIYGQISKLHDQKISSEEMRGIQHKISEVIRKYNPIEEINVVGSQSKGGKENE